MLTTLSILSLDQGRLSPKDQTEDQYFARFAPPDRTGRPLAVPMPLRLLALIRRTPVPVKGA